MEAARDGIELSEVSVSVESDSDFRGVLGVDDSVNPGPVALRIRIDVAAHDATEDELRDVVSRAEARSPVRDAIAREMSMTTEIVTATAEPQPT